MKKSLLFFSAITFFGLQANSQTILGVDVSHYDGAITWTQVKAAGKTFAWAKATQGIDFTDPDFITNDTAGTAAGVIMGGYHFATPETNSNAADEANYFLSVARPYIGGGYLPPVLDLEDPGGTTLENYFTSAALTAWVQTWMTTVQNATGVAPVLYTDASIAGYLNSSLNTYGLWMADPNTSANTPPTNIGVWTTWAFKQYSWTGNVAGIGGGTAAVDLDVFNGNITTFINLIGGGAVAPAFTASVKTVCAGNTVSFTDQSTSTGTITGHRWTFSGGTPDTSSTANPTITYLTAGVYNVKEVVTATTGSDSITKTAYIQVIPDSSLPLVETFQSSIFPPPGWTMNFPNPGDSAWELCTNNGYNSSQCMYFPANCGYVTSIAGERQQIYTPAYSFAGTSNPEMWFDVAYEPYNSTYSDTLAIYYSLDCGNTWNLIYLKGGMTLCTTGSTDAAGTDTSGGNGCFVPPNSHAWRTDTINLASLTGDASVMFSFESRSGWGNIIYIDNINIASTGCTAPAAPVIQAFPGLTNCGPVQLTASSSNCPACTYKWSNNLTDSVISVTSTGTYRVTSTNGGCAGSPSSVAVTINQAPTVSANASSPQVCANQSVTLTATGNAASYQWSGTGLQTTTGSSVNAVVSIAGNQTYTVTAALNGCTATASASVSVNASLVPSISISQITANPVCTGSQISFSSSIVNGGTNPVYHWTSGAQTGTGNSFTLNAASNGATVNCLLISNAACADSDSVFSNVLTVTTQSPLPVAVTISTADTNVCSGENILFTSSATNAGNNPVYEWHVNGASQDSGSSYTLDSIHSNSTVYCVLTASGACLTGSPATSNAINMHIQLSAQASLNISADTTIICAGTTVIFTATPANGGNAPVYEWKLNGNTVGFNALDYTTDSLRNGDMVSCSMTSSASCVTNPDVVSNSITMRVNPLPTATLQVNFCDLAAQYFTGVSYQWFLQGQAIGGASSRFYEASQSGYYDVKVSDSAGCSAQSSDTFIAYPGCRASGIEPVAENPGFDVYPNPANSELVVSFINTINGKASIEIFDAWGQLVYSQNDIIILAGNQYSLNISALASGVYLIRVKNDESRFAVKSFIKM